MQCKEWDDANSELFKESHDEAVHKNSYKSRLYELISASLGGRQLAALASPFGACGTNFLHGKACHWILSRLWLPANPVPLPPRKRWDNKPQ